MHALAVEFEENAFRASRQRGRQDSLVCTTFANDNRAALTALPLLNAPRGPAAPCRFGAGTATVNETYAYDPASHRLASVNSGLAVRTLSYAKA